MLEVKLMDNRGQTTFEYLLLVGGVVILAVLIIWMLTTGVQASGGEVNETLVNTADDLGEQAENAMDALEDVMP